MRVSTSIPLLGLNWNVTANPYLVIPVNQFIQVELTACESKYGVEIKSMQPGAVLEEHLKLASHKLTQVYNHLSSKAGKGFCLSVYIPEDNYVPLVSAYTASILSAIYIVLKEILKGKPGEEDIIDIASFIWSDKKPGIKMLYEALLISAMRRKPILYRGSGEQILLEDFVLNSIQQGRVIPLDDIIERYFDPQLESALVKLEGISIISAVNTLASKSIGNSFDSKLVALQDFFKIDNAIGYILYDLPVSRENCKYIQSVEGYLEEICLGRD
ncbi:MAG: hypothetical protein F7B59_00825 [Desulfurococcales archaeon]|nr:hypothetical protein [Desulfurococcales archaeon]